MPGPQNDPLRLAPDPIAGPLFREAAQVPLSPGEKERERRLLLVLLAAHADAGNNSPSIRELADKLGVEGEPRALKVDKLLRSLQRDGVIRVRWVNRKRQGRGERNCYELILDRSRIERQDELDPRWAR